MEDFLIGRLYSSVRLLACRVFAVGRFFSVVLAGLVVIARVVLVLRTIITAG